MKILFKKGIFNKLILVLIILVLFNAIIPSNVCLAAQDDNSLGGVLLKPIADLLLFLGDAIMDLMHNIVYGLDHTIIKIDKNNGVGEFFAIIGAFLLGAIVLGAVSFGIVAAGAAIAKIAVSVAVEKAIVSIVAVTVGGGVVAGAYVRSEWFSDEWVFPLYYIVPEQIFSGEITMLDANFFKTKEDIEKENENKKIDLAYAQTINKNLIYNNNASYSSSLFSDSDQYEKKLDEMQAKLNELGCTSITIRSMPMPAKLGFGGAKETIKRTWNTVDETGKEIWYEAALTEGYISSASAGGGVSNYYYNDLSIYEGEAIGKETTTLGLALKDTISKWYYAMRSFALIIMMVILIYIGIRIMLCGVASEKAKYKNMLVDWFVGVCLIFVMHYIMTFSMNVVDGIIKIVGQVNNEKEYVEVYEYDDKIIKELQEAGIDTEQIVEDVDGGKVISWNARNMIGLARVQASLVNSGSTLYIGWTICYLVLVIQTIFFFFTYLKRALYLAFFTIIAPLVAMTYPIDKLHDGKAQAFDMWLKEYIFNLMIQPVHLLLYTVLISSAFELASTNILYTITAIGFLMPAEKFLRKMFGFDKAQTPGFLGGPAGTALIMSGMNKIFNRKPPKGEDKKGGSLGDKSGKDKNTFKTTDDSNPRDMLGNSVSEDDKAKMSQIADNVKNQSFAEKEKADMGRRLNEARNRAGTEGASKAPNEKSKNNQFTWQMPHTSAAEKIAEEQKRAGHPINNNGDKTQKGKFKEFLGKRGRAIKGYAGSYLDQKKKKFGRSLASGEAIDSIARKVKGVGLGATGALLGASIALADDDPLKKMTQYAGGLGAAGYAVGSRKTNPDYDADQAYEDAERAFYGSQEEYDKAVQEREVQKIIRDEKNQRRIRENLKLESDREAREYMERYIDSIKSGVTDMDDLSTIMRLVDDGVMDQRMATTVAQNYKDAGGKPKKMGKKDRENIESKYKRIFANEGITDESKNNEAVQIALHNLDVFGSYKDKLSRL